MKNADSQTTKIPCNDKTENQCTQPWHMDDGIPYCDTCGLFRWAISRQENNSTVTNFSG